MEIVNTKDRANVEAIWKYSMQLVTQGKAVTESNWDKNSPWHNSKFTETQTQSQWVIYLADHAWPGEVKLIVTNMTNT